jgi:nucleotide-binding universal stress UspA family protein
MTFTRIMCAVDFSDGAMAAVGKAAELARHSSANLFILHVLEAQPVISQWLTPDRLGQVTVELQEAAKESMDQLIDSGRFDGVEVKTEITNGRAFVEIVNKAGEWNADLVVLGAKGLASIEQLVMGSTAERVLKESACSVLVVK